jgi:hypothetical protein
MTTTGGAHNALHTVLAERGLFAAVAAVVVALYLLRLAIRLYQSREQFTGMESRLARLAPFIVILILIRSLGEMPGWFGYADSLVDFLAYGAAALIVALAAMLDLAVPPSTEALPVVIPDP